jgi:nicotinate dehydrogenase subunit B
MTKLEQTSAFTRRSMLLGSGALVVSIGAAVSLDTLLSMQQASAQGAKPPLTPDQLSSYIAVNADGTVSAFFGKMDMGHGLFVAIGQIVAEELDVPFKSVKVYMGDTANSVNQGGASGSTGIRWAANKCAWRRRKPAACWSRWRPANWPCRPTSSSSLMAL